MLTIVHIDEFLVDERTVCSRMNEIRIVFTGLVSNLRCDRKSA